MASTIDRIRELRRATGEALVATITDAGDTPTERHISEGWHDRLQRIPGVASEGWYMPPPHGIIVAIGTRPSFERIDRGSFRPSDTWPDDATALGVESLLFAYASPVERRTGLIGDWGCSLYRGSDEALRAHLSKVWTTTMAIVESVHPDMTFATLYEAASAMIADAGLRNLVDSVHGGSVTDIGHTLPWAALAPTPAECAVLEGGSAQAIADLVSAKRTFVNATNDQRIGDTSAFTIEPRLVAPGLPMAGFHVVVAFENGRKHVVSEFDSIFDLFDMQWLR